MFTSPFYLQPGAIGFGALPGHFYLPAPSQIIACQRAFGLKQTGQVARVDNSAAMDTRPRAKIDYKICRLDGLLVMLDYQNRVAKVAQPAQSAYQARIVALMQADSWLVQHVEHLGQPRAKLTRQPYALGFSS